MCSLRGALRAGQCLPFHQSKLHKEDLAQDPHPKQSFLGRLSPKGLSRLQHLKHFHRLASLLVLQRCQLPRHCYFLEDEAISWIAFAVTHGVTLSRGHHTCLLNEWKKKRIRSTLGEDTNTFLGHKHLLRKCLGDWLPAVRGPFFEMTIKCGYFLAVERTTLENLSSTSHVISRSGGTWVAPLNRRRAQCGPRVRLQDLSCTASLRPHLHQP